MRAAVLHGAGEVPEVGEFQDPPDGEETVDVRLAGVNPVDLILASGAMGEPDTPAVVGQEGVGRASDGRRVYFNSPPSPFGSWAQRSAVDSARTFPVPDEVDDELAVALGIAGLAAWLPLTRHAEVSGGESVLVLGATGIVGRIAVQAARVLGAGRIVAAGRDPDALRETVELGADATVSLDSGDMVGSLAAEAGDGYEVVIDAVYGEPFLAALQNTAVGATLVTIGLGAGASADVPFAALQGRTHIGHGNTMMAPEVLREGYAELTDHAARGEIRVSTQVFGLDEAAEAWRAQQDGPHLKLAIAP